MRDSAGCLNHEDYSQISHGEVSEKYLRSLFNVSKIQNCMQGNNLTKGDVFDKADYIFDHVDSLRNNQQSLIDSVSGSEDDYIIIDNIVEQGKYIHLHYEHFSHAIPFAYVQRYGNALAERRCKRSKGANAARISHMI